MGCAGGGSKGDQKRAISAARRQPRDGHGSGERAGAGQARRRRRSAGKAPACGARGGARWRPRRPQGACGKLPGRDDKSARAHAVAASAAPAAYPLPLPSPPVLPRDTQAAPGARQPDGPSPCPQEPGAQCPAGRGTQPLRQRDVCGARGAAGQAARTIFRATGQRLDSDAGECARPGSLDAANSP